MVTMLKLITIPAQGTRFLARAIMFRTLANLYSNGYKYFFADSWKVKPELSASKPAPDGSLTSDFPVWNMSLRYFFDWCYMFTSITNLENCLPRACITITCTPWRVVFKSLNSPLSGSYCRCLAQSLSFMRIRQDENLSNHKRTWTWLTIVQQHLFRRNL